MLKISRSMISLISGDIAYYQQRSSEWKQKERRESLSLNKACEVKVESVRLVTG